MIVNLVGIYQDGSIPPPGVTVPSAATSLEFAVGTAVTINMTVLNAAGNAVSYVNQTYTMRVRKNPGDATNLLTYVASLVLGQQQFVIPSADSISKLFYGPGVYYFDVWQVNSVTGASDNVIPLSGLILDPSTLQVIASS